LAKLKKLITYRNATIIVFGILFLIVLATFPDYGISWDERWHLNYGYTLINYYRSLLHGQIDAEATTYRDLFVYGGVFDLTANIGIKLLGVILPFGKMELRHLVTALTGLLGIGGTWAVGRKLGGERAGFWAVVFLATTPAYYGHIFFNPKDIPFAAGYIWSLYFLLILLQDQGGYRWLKLSGFALVTGLTMGVRVGGIFLLFYFGLVLLWNYWRHPVLKSGSKLVDFSKRVLLPAFAVGLFSYLVMLIFWPWAQQNPVLNPLIALREISQFGFPHPVLFNGQFIMATELPWNYLITYFVVSLPEILLLLCLVGGIWAFVRLLRTLRSHQFPSYRFMGGVVLLLAVIIPIITAILARSTLYDGLRHFIFVIPPLVCLVAITFSVALDWLAKINRKLDIVITGLVSLYLIVQIVVMIQLHPYEYIYYNQLVGGVPGAYRRFETDYWGTAESAAAKWLVKYLHKEGQGEQEVTYVFIGCADEFSAYYYFPPQVQWTLDESLADYYILSTRWFCSDQVTGEEIYRVSRQGVPISVIKKVVH
jgi:hypothetical protein